MKRPNRLHRLVATSLVALCVLTLTNQAIAGYGYSPHARYSQPTVRHHSSSYSISGRAMIQKRVPVRVRVKAYKPCGSPYYTWKVVYQTVLVGQHHY